MTALANNKMSYEQVQENIRAQAEADRTTIAGPELNIRLSLSPRMILLLASPVAVLVSVAMGWLILTSMGMPLYGREMFAAAILNVVGGTVAALPLFFWMKRGAAAIAAGGLVGIAVRCMVILGGLLLAMGPGWQLAKMPLVYWVLGCYFPLLIAETAMVGWLCHRTKH
jgi:hypothetical protein